jgi:hypothetical protein
MQIAGARTIAEFFQDIGKRANIYQADCTSILGETVFPFLDGAFAMLDPEQKAGLLDALHAYQPGLRHEGPESVAYDLGFPETIDTLEPGSGVPDLTQEALIEAIGQLEDSRSYGGGSYQSVTNRALPLLQKYEGKFSLEQLNAAMLQVFIKWLDDHYRRNAEGELIQVIDELTRQGANVDQLLDEIDAQQHESIVGSNASRFELPASLVEHLTLTGKQEFLAEIYQRDLDDRLN